MSDFIWFQISLRLPSVMVIRLISTPALTESLEIKKLYYTNGENHDFYAKQYALQKKLVKQDMKEAFHTLKALH